MKNFLLAAAVAFTLLHITGCQSYGKKVKINDNLDVYVKNQATEEEGRKLGEFIATLDSSSNEEKSIQLSKDGEVYTVKLVIPDESINNRELETSFQALQYVIRENVFPGKKVNLVLADNKFNDKRTVEELEDMDDEVEVPASLVQPGDTTVPAR